MLRKIIGKLKSLTGSIAPKPSSKTAPVAAAAKPERSHLKPARPQQSDRGSHSRSGKPYSRSEQRPSRSGHSQHHGNSHGGERPRHAPAPRPPQSHSPDDRATALRNVPPVPSIPEDNAFLQIGLAPFVAAAVSEKGYTEPTPIQAQAIPVILAGRDLLGTAQTGTGKTAAFALPVLNKLQSHGGCRCLILEPTRELALQVDESLREYGKFTDVRATVIYGGVGYGRQREELARGTDIIVATPGRLLDLMEEGFVDLRNLQMLVLDEVDRMLDMGFLPDVKRIIARCPAQRQTLLFSATMPPAIQSLTMSVLRDPQTIEIGVRSSPAETVDHAFYPVVASQKFDLLVMLLEKTSYKSVIVFTRTKMGADRIASRLEREGHAVGVMHSDRSQRERTEALQGFKSGKFELLVATDLAARGLDIRGVTHVVNYDMPENPEDYVHRIGRTGRAQSEGDAYTLMTEDDLRFAAAIERMIKRPVPRRKIDGFEYLYSALFDAVEAPKTSSRLHRGRR